jgi:hypothetical protein
MKLARSSFTLLGIVGLSLLGGGCAGEDPVPGPEWDVELGTASLHLSPIDGCADVEEALRQAAYLSIRASLYDEMTWWLENGEATCEASDERDGDMLAATDGGDASSGSGGGSAAGGDAPKDVSGTNNQVADVDEADILKTDDDGFIYVLSGDALHVVDGWPVEEADRIGSIVIEGTPRKLFVRGDRALVYSSLTADGPSDSWNTSAHEGPTGECTYGYDCVPRGDGHPTKLTVIDLSDRTNPVVVRELRSNGSLLAARRIDDVVHTVVTMQGPGFPVRHDAGVRCDGDDAPDAEEIIDRFTALLLENRALIEETPITAVMPSLTDSATGADDELAACPSFYRGRVAAGTSFTTLISMSLDGAAAPSASTVVSEPGVVYASASSLYMAVPERQSDVYGWYDGYGDQRQLSVVHRFALGEDGRSAYAASGAVKGRVLNQFAMDEHDGHLRIATTTGRAPDPDAHSTLSVLEQEGPDLRTVGVVDGIAPSEDIRSVRFSGDRGFVVTFKKTDPLFVFDLSVPSMPRVLSELKIPGFSTYMHMMDATHLLTIGYDADDHGDFAYFDGVLLQIFDVSDPEEPILAHKEVIGTRGSSSEALTNHLAFNYFASKDLLALPMTICEGGDDGTYGAELTFSGLMVYDVTAEGGFSLRGKLPFPTDEAAPDPYGGGLCSSWWSSASSVVRRSVIMDDYVYGVTDTLVRAAALDALDQPIASIDLAADQD